MGDPNDPMAVVDAQLRVYGIERLRIADASVMPQLPSGNTHATCIMIAEYAADLLNTAYASTLKYMTLLGFVRFVSLPVLSSFLALSVLFLVADPARTPVSEYSFSF
jgi:hypothetical protein